MMKIFNGKVMSIKSKKWNKSHCKHLNKITKSLPK